MKSIAIFLFLWLLASSVIESTFGIKIDLVRGVSYKNIAMLLMIAGLCIINVFQKRPFIQKSSVNFPIFAFLAYCFISLTLTKIYSNPNSPFTSTFLLGTLNFKTFADNFILFFIIYSLIHEIKTTKLLIFALLIMLLLNNVLTIMGAFDIIHIAKAGFREKYGRSGGAFGQANTYAAYITLFIPIAANAFINMRGIITKIIIGAIVSSSFISILLTGSRGGIISLVVGLGALVVANAKKVSPFLIFKMLVSLLIIGCLFYAAFYFLPETSKSGLKLNIVDRAEDQDLNTYSSGRLGTWTAALELFTQNPVFGTGYGTTVSFFGVDSHNDYIKYLMELGIVGFSLFLFLLYRLFKTARKFRDCAGEDRWYFNGYLAGLVAFTVGMMFVNLKYIHFYFFIYSALIFKMGFLEMSDSDEAEMEKAVKRRDNIVTYDQFRI